MNGNSVRYNQQDVQHSNWFPAAWWWCASQQCCSVKTVDCLLETDMSKTQSVWCTIGRRVLPLRDVISKDIIYYP